MRGRREKRKQGEQGRETQRGNRKGRESEEENICRCVNGKVKKEVKERRTMRRKWGKGREKMFGIREKEVRKYERQ